MATQEASGTVTPTTIGTEQTVVTISTAKPFQTFFDISALAVGEYVLLTIKRKVLSGGTSHYVQKITYSWLDAMITPVVTLDAILSTSEYDVTINQLTGTARAFPWAVETP